MLMSKTFLSYRLVVGDVPLNGYWQCRALACIWRPGRLPFETRVQAAIPTAAIRTNASEKAQLTLTLTVTLTLSLALTLLVLEVLRYIHNGIRV